MLHETGLACMYASVCTLLICIWRGIRDLFQLPSLCFEVKRRPWPISTLEHGVVAFKGRRERPTFPYVRHHQSWTCCGRHTCYAFGIVRAFLTPRGKVQVCEWNLSLKYAYCFGNKFYTCLQCCLHVALKVQLFWQLRP